MVAVNTVDVLSVRLLHVIHAPRVVNLCELKIHLISMYTVYSVSKIITNLNVTNLIWSNFNELEPISISFAHKISSE